VSLPVFASALVVFLMSKPPVVLLVDERAGNVAVLSAQGLVPAVPKQAAASVSRWLAQSGDDASFKQASTRSAWTCAAQNCMATAGTMQVAYVLKSSSPFVKCPTADVLVSQEPLRRRCKGKRLTIDRFDVWRNGAYSVDADGTATHVRGVQGFRPWVYEPRARAKR
jgi:competence protein ComEC